MTPVERDLVLGLVTPSRDRPRLTPDAFLEACSEQDGRALAARLMAEALRRRNPDEVQMALIVCSVFGAPEGLLPTLIELLDAGWHRAHEDLVSLLAPLQDPRAVPALTRAAQQVPDHLTFDENRALATKAVWALGAVPGPLASEALQSLTASDSDVVRTAATEQLTRRAGAAPALTSADPDAARYPALAALMQLYLDPGWKDDFESVDTAVETFFREDPAATLLGSDLTDLLATPATEEDLRDLLLGLGGGYVPDPTTSTLRAWLSALADRAREARR